MGRNLGPLNIKDSYEGLVQISGSNQLTDGSGSLISSLDVSASTATSASHALNADNAVSSSFATTASFALNVVPIDTGSFMVTGSATDATLTFTKGDASTFDLVVDNVANATSASFATTAATASSLEGGVSLQTVLDTGNTATEDINLTGKLTQGSGTLTNGSDKGAIIGANGATLSGNTTGQAIAGGDGPTISGRNSFVGGGSIANITVLNSGIVAGRSNKIESGQRSFIGGGNANEIKTSAGDSNAILGGSSNDITAGTHNAIVAGTSNINTHNRSVVIGGNGLSTTKDDEVVVPSLVANDITASFASFQSASIGYLEAITGSAKIIGDAFIILNNNTPTERYAGLVVQDSGSTNNTASLEFDGQTNDWFYEYTDDGGATVDHGVAMFGPEYNTKGSPAYPTNNRIQKGDGGHHLLDSSITDDGSTITLGNKLDGLTVSGSVEITGSTTIEGTIQTGGTGHVTSGAQSAAVGGDQSNVTGERGVGIGGFQNTISGTDAAVIGGFGQTASGLRSGVFGGLGNNATNIYSATLGGSSVNAEGIRATMVGGDGNTVDSSTNDGVIIGSYQSNIENQGHNSTIINSFQSNIDGYSGSVILGGVGIDADAHNTAYANNLHLTGSGATLTFDDGTTMTTAGGGGSAFPYTGSAEITGSLRVIGGLIAGDSLNVGSGDNAMVLSQDSNATATRSGVFAGYQNTASDTDSAVLGGFGNTASGLRGAVVSGQSNTASHIRSVVVGGISLSTSKDDEAVVNHLSIYGDTLVDDGTNTGTLLNNVGQSAVSSEDAVNTVIHLTQAEYDALTPDANTLYVIEGAETLGDTEIDGQLTGAVNTISDASGTTALDCSVGNYFTLAMPSGGTTELVPSNITAGQTINIEITQNSTASTLTYDNAIEFPGGTAFTISTGNGEVDILTLVSFDGINLKATGLANFS